MQALAPTTVLPWQVPPPQGVLSGYFRQPPMPSHRPSRPQVDASCLGHWLSSAGGMPAGTGAHMPALPGTSHFWQVPLQALLQQTPSTQKPEPHSSAQLQRSPMPFLSTTAWLHELGAISLNPVSNGPSFAPLSTRTPLSEVRQATAPNPSTKAKTNRGNVGRVSDMILLPEAARKTARSAKPRC